MEDKDKYTDKDRDTDKDTNKDTNKDTDKDTDKYTDKDTDRMPLFSQKASPTIISPKCFLQFAFLQAFHVMTVVPNQANDMMDIGRLQGFEVNSSKHTFRVSSFFILVNFHCSWMPLFTCSMLAN